MPFLKVSLLLGYPRRPDIPCISSNEGDISILKTWMLVQGSNKLKLGRLSQTVLALISHFSGENPGPLARTHNLKVHLTALC